MKNTDVFTQIFKKKKTLLSVFFLFLITTFFVSPIHAADTILSSSYSDNNNDGTVDTITLGFDETINTCDYEAGDWSIDTAGSINLTAINNISCTGSDAFITIDITANTSVTGGTTDPVISYQNQGILGSITGAGAISNKSAVTVSDNAQPALLSFSSTTANNTYGPSSNINITATYTENINSGSITVTLDNGASVSLSSINNTEISGTYSVGVTGSGEDSSDLTVTSITSESITDSNTNTRTNSSIPSTNIASNSDIVIDVTAPNVTEVTAVTNPTNDTTPSYTFSSSEAGNITYGGSCSSATSSATSGNNVIDFNLLTENTYSDCTITVTDSTGNVSTALPVTTFEIDTTAPTIVSARTTDSATIEITFSEQVQSAQYTDFGIDANTSGSGMSSSSNLNSAGGIGTVTLNPSISTGATPTLYFDPAHASGIEDLAGNMMIAQNLVVSDEAAPTLSNVSISSSNTDITKARESNTITLSFTSSETLNADPVVTIAGKSASIDNSSAPNYSATYTLTDTETEGVAAISIDFTDSAGNAGTTVTSTSDTSAVTIDITAPNVTEVTAVTNPTNDTTPSYTFSSSEAGNITYGGSCSSATSSATSGNNVIDFNLLTENTYSDCTITVTDSTGNISTALPVTTFEIDTTAPTISSISVDTSTIYDADLTQSVTVIYSETMNTGVNPSITAGNSTHFTPSAGVWSTTTVTNDTYSVVLTHNANAEEISNETVSVAATAVDLAGNTESTGATSSSFIIDTQDPVLAISLGDSDLTIGETTTISFDFSEDVVNFDETDITVETGAISGFAQDGVDSTLYTATFTPTADTQDASNLVTVGTAWTDTNGNSLSTNTTSANYQVDTLAPSISNVSVTTSDLSNIFTTDDYAKEGETITYTLTYSENVTVSAVTASTANNISAAVTSDVSATNAASDSIIFTVSAGDTGTVTPNTISFTITDTAGNETIISSLGSITGNTIIADTTAPTLSSTTVENGTPNQIGLSFDENVVITDSTGVTVTVAGLARSLQSSVNGSDSTNLVFTLSADVIEADQIATLDYSAGNITDRAGNPLADIVNQLITNNIVEGSPFIDSLILNSSTTLPSSDATVTWNTQDTLNGAGTGTLNTISNQVEYGTSTTLGLTQNTTTGDSVSTHSASLTGLTPNTLYYYRVKSVANGKTSYSQIFSFTTARGNNGLYVDSISVIDSSAVYDATNPYENGWHFQFNITADSDNESFLRAKFDNWVSSSNAFTTADNVKMLISSAGNTSANEATINAGTDIKISYDAGTTVNISGVSDNDPSKAGKQFVIDIFVKVPTSSTPAGSYSSSYGFTNQSVDTNWSTLD